MARRRGVIGFLLSVLVLWAAPALGQGCPGDCDSNQSVSIAELIRGVDIALGARAVADCRAVDANNDDAVTIDELVDGVDRALFGCAGGRDTTVRATSSVAVSSVFSLLDFGYIGGGAGGGVAAGLASARRLAQAGGGAGNPGCQPFECISGGVVTGIEEICCDFGRVTITDFQCIIDDGFGNVTERDGFRAIDSEDFDPCDLVIPPGASFVSEFGDYVQSVRDASGNFSIFAANSVSFFTADPEGCVLAQPDPLGLGALGDGFLVSDGSVREIEGNANGVTADTSTTSFALSLDILSFQEDTCEVDVTVTGQLDVSDFLAGEQFSQTYHEYFISEIPLSGGNALLDIDGFTTTDCLGDVYQLTREPLRVSTDAECPTGGVLEVTTLADEKVSTVGYTTSGGLEFDFDDDGSIDQRLGSCEDLELQQCEVATPQEQCAPCDQSGSFECGSELVCAPCLVCEGAPSRCAPPGDFAICEDDIFGEFGF